VGVRGKLNKIFVIETDKVENIGKGMSGFFDLFWFYWLRMVDLSERTWNFKENRPLKILGGFPQSSGRE